MINNKEYRFMLIMVSKSGNYIMDLGKYNGRAEILNSIMEHMTEDDLTEVAKIYQAKIGKITTKEVDKYTSVGNLNCIIGSKIIKKHMEENGNAILDDEGVSALNSTLMSDVKFVRVVMTFNATKGGCGDIFIIGDDEPLNPSTVFGRIYDSKRKKFKDRASI